MADENIGKAGLLETEINLYKFCSIIIFIGNVVILKINIKLYLFLFH